MRGLDTTFEIRGQTQSECDRPKTAIAIVSDVFPSPCLAGFVVVFALLALFNHRNLQSRSAHRIVMPVSAIKSKLGDRIALMPPSAIELP
ncbi:MULTISPECIES: hypothetical protein [unclassified Microcoleus]|uniref:hypothetical protein n=1 Tax=unclassified Microcoleus TaxID=2642155 RepID=UPI002FD6C144